MRKLRMLVFVVTGGVVASGAAAAPPAPGLAPGARNRVTGTLCDPARATQVGDRETPKARTLGELPPGNVMLTVVREVDGCAAPVIVRYGLSGSGGQAEPVAGAKRRR